MTFFRDCAVIWVPLVSVALVAVLLLYAVSYEVAAVFSYVGTFWSFVVALIVGPKKGSR